MSVRETSLEAYRELDRSGRLQGQERDLMLHAWRLFPPPVKFTRRELKDALKNEPGWEWNVISGRCTKLVAKKFLIEYPETRDGGHLLSINSGETEARGQAPSPGKPGDGAASSSCALPAPAASMTLHDGTPVEVVREGVSAYDGTHYCVVRAVGACT